MSVLFEGVNKTFVSSFSRKKVVAVTDLYLNIKPGEVFGIVGPNGAGKSTILKMVMGFIKSDSGKITVLGSSPLESSSRLNIGYLPENPYYYDHLSAEDLMKFSATTSGMDKAAAAKSINRLLEKMNLQHARKRKLRTYSKGMTQRAGICFALVHDPELVIFDEPMSGLDPIGRKLVVDMVLDLKKRGKTVLFCSHILNDVERLCDRMAIMDNGKLKTILVRDELIAKQREVIMQTDVTSDALNDIKKPDGIVFRDIDGVSHAVCPPDKVQDTLKQISGMGINVKNIYFNENTLENLFFNTIERTQYK